MHKKRLLKLANFIEDHPERDEDGKKLKLNMDRWVDQSACGTVACIAGFAVMQRSRRKTLTGKINEMLGFGRRVEAEAAEYLGLDYWDRSLFLPNNYPSSFWSKITAKRAAGVIRHFVKTGQIDWNRTRYPSRDDVQ